VIAFIGLMAAPAMADHHFDADREDAIGDADQRLAAELEAFLEDYAAAYNDQDYRTVKRMWHADGNPIYMAEEVPFPLYGSERMDKYFDPVPGKRILDGIDNRYSEVRAKYVAPNVAVATYRLDYDLKLAGTPAVHGWNRIMAVFVATDDGWKLSAYAEAPMGPRSMARRMMQATPARGDAEQADYEITLRTLKSLTERAVSPGFAEFLEARKDLEPTH
jgi:ketosteroid isomerase-like protein